MKTVLEPSAVKKIERMIFRALEQGRETLREDEVYGILRICGFRTPAYCFIEDRRALEEFDRSSLPSGGLVCKFLSPGIVHRSEHGGVRFTGGTAGEVVETFEEFEAIARRMGVEFSGMLVAEALDIDESIPNQLILSLRQDRSFGPVVAVGLGGTGTEVYQEALRPEKGLALLHASDCGAADRISKALAATMFFPILAGRTRISSVPALEPGRVVEAVRRFAALASSFSPLASWTPVTVEELEVNPMQVMGGSLVPLDAMMRISRSKHCRADPPAEKIGRLLEPESILVIGASAEKSNMGRVILRNILAEGKTGREKIFVLHPRAESIEGCRAFSSPADLPGPVDMTVFTVPASPSSVELIEGLIGEGRTESMILISGGFEETEAGADLSLRLARAIEAGRETPGGGTVVNGPNCMGIVSRPGGYNTFFLPEYKMPMEGSFGGNCAVISQSGAWLVTLLNTQSSFLDPKYMITVGNQADLTITDHLDHLSGDPDLDLYCIYLEGLKEWEGDRFIRVARGIRESGGRIVLYKAGRTAEGAAAEASHTAAMAGDYDVLRRLVSSAGVHVADSLEKMEDAVKILAPLSGRPVRGRRVGITSDAGFECSVAADRLGALELARFSEETIERLSEHLPTGIIDVHNPVDATPAITTADYGRCVGAVIDDPGTDCLIVSNVASTPFQENLPAGPGHREDIRHEGSHPNTIISLFRSTDKPMAVCMNEGSIYDPAVEMMELAGVPVFRKIDRAVRAMGIFVELSGAG